MKPRPGWIIAEGAASARRKDGVEAGFYFLGDDKPYSAKKGFVFTRHCSHYRYAVWKIVDCGVFVWHCDNTSIDNRCLCQQVLIL